MAVLTNTGLGVISKRLISNSALPNIIKIGDGATSNAHSASVADTSLYNPYDTVTGALSNEMSVINNDTSVITGIFDFVTDSAIDEIGILAGSDLVVSITPVRFTMSAGETLTVIVKLIHRGA